MHIYTKVDSGMFKRTLYRGAVFLLKVNEGRINASLVDTVCVSIKPVRGLSMSSVSNGVRSSSSASSATAVENVLIL